MLPPNSCQPAPTWGEHMLFTCYHMSARNPSARHLRGACGMPVVARQLDNKSWSEWHRPPKHAPCTLFCYRDKGRVRDSKRRLSDPERFFPLACMHHSTLPSLVLYHNTSVCSNRSTRPVPRPGKRSRIPEPESQTLVPKTAQQCNRDDSQKTGPPLYSCADLRDSKQRAHYFPVRFVLGTSASCLPDSPRTAGL